MSQRTQLQPYMSNSLLIRQEIQRFESVHPSIYAIYDLIEAIPDPLVQQQVREHVVCIEDSFVNSQEWTLSRAVPDLKLGIVGSVNSGKSALVHRYLTGSYMQEESPEGGRFKKEVLIDNQSHLLLIRDEGGPPEMQFTHWVDAVILVFSLENESSFKAVYDYYAKMANYRNTTEIPLILVGTQDSISESNPRVIDDTMARKLANDLKRCLYYETCATYGLNVERVFTDACSKVIAQRYSSMGTTITQRPSTPNHAISRTGTYGTNTQCQTPIHSSGSGKPYDTHSTGSMSSQSGTPPNSSHNIQGQTTPFMNEKKEHKNKKHDKITGGGHPSSLSQQSPQHQTSNVPPLPLPLNDQHMRQEQLQELRLQLMLRQDNNNFVAPDHVSTPSVTRKNASKKSNGVQKSNSFNGSLHGGETASTARPSDLPTPTSTPVLGRKNKNKSNFLTDGPAPNDQGKDLPTPTSTPTQTRKSRRRSNIFTPGKKEGKNGELGCGRAIPIKQGYLYKKSSKGLNRDWKKKYVTLMDNGMLIYHPSLHDYMDESHGKEISLLHTTVKIPGQRPRGSTVPGLGPGADVKGKENAQFAGSHFENKDPRLASISSNCDDALIIPNSSINPGMNAAGMPGPGPGPGGKIETPNVKKRHRRVKSSAKADPSNVEDLDGYEFLIVSLDNKQWHFEAPTESERDGWMSSIENQILSSLQGVESSKSKVKSVTDPAAVQSIKSVRGNAFCADCMSPNPVWASLNLGALVCIECSGIHRNLGTHVSRVRSLDLDEWPPDLVTVMVTMGNSVANSVWEGSYMMSGKPKPTPSTLRETKESWIRSKYEIKEFLPPLPQPHAPVGKQLIDSVTRDDIRTTILILAHAKPDQVNARYSNTDARRALHVAAALGKAVIVQLLLWYNADIRTTDQEGRNALWYAKSAGKKNCVDILLANGCPESTTLPRRRINTAQNSSHAQQGVGHMTTQAGHMTTQAGHMMSQAGHVMSQSQYNQQIQHKHNQGPPQQKGDVFDRLPASVI